jgi:UDPglucose 6-dehydrogenase
MKTDSKSRQVVVVGCGKLGAPLVACLADSGHTVVGIDLNSALIDSLGKNEVTWNEPGLQELLQKNTSRIIFQDRYTGAYKNAEVTFVIVPTPSLPSGDFSNGYVISSIKEIAKELSVEKISNHLIVIVSTVMPGSTSGIIRETLEQNLTIKDHQIKIAYSPEFIALGSVIKNMHFPDLVLIGESSPGDGDLLQEISLSVAKNEPQVFTLTTEEAEIAKIAINSFVTTKISFSNQISEICERTPGASASKVLRAIGTDTRIGNSYLTAATAFGGPCFPRDNRAFAKYANDLGSKADLAVATDSINLRQTERLMSNVKTLLVNKKRLCVVGLSYKPDTDVIEESPSIKFIELATKEGFHISAVDNNVLKVKEFADLPIYNTSNFQEANEEFDAYVVFVPSKEYSQIPNNISRDKIIIDLWGIWDEFKKSFGENYMRLGNYSG